VSLLYVAEDRYLFSSALQFLMTWFNEPENWKHEGDWLLVRAKAGTDFWRKTHYGFIRDNGHFYYERVTGDFLVETEFAGQYASLYDQAGLMVRLDPTVWVKAGIEYVNGVHYVSAVVTREYSDWSVIPLDAYSGSLRLRLRRERGTVVIEYGSQENSWIMIRNAHLSDVSELEVGRMVAAPDGPGFEATFTHYGVTRSD
jgi:regulation of enolase protein 1 (concanavalin A-like superfamily)